MVPSGLNEFDLLNLDPQTLTPPESRIRDVKAASSIYDTLRKADEKSSSNRARIDAMFDGASPYDQRVLFSTGQGNRTNLNFGEAQRLLDVSMSAYVDLYTSLEKLDPALLEAAEVLGAKPAARFWKVIWPLSLPGVAAGCLLTFIPALGSYLTSDLLGGAKQMMVGNLVQNQFTTARNWPFGSAASFIVMGGVLVAVVLYLRLRDRAPGGGL
jgi:hypothetical protein